MCKLKDKNRGRKSLGSWKRNYSIVSNRFSENDQQLPDVTFNYYSNDMGIGFQVAVWLCYIQIWTNTEHKFLHTLFSFGKDNGTLSVLIQIHVKCYFHWSVNLLLCNPGPIQGWPWPLPKFLKVTKSTLNLLTF